jgi:hypothetical protein
MNKNMKTLCLVIFNEIFWDKGLIYTQNISPLLKLNQRKLDVNIKIISFTSIFLMLVKWKEIKCFRKDLKTKKVTLTNFPILFYPSRHFIIRWFLFPFFVLNVLPYLIYLNIKDLISKIFTQYTIRSYSGALAFLLFYYKKDRLYFDPRTDWIIENKNIGRWKEGGVTDRLWNSWEKKIISRFRKTIFISDVFKSDLIQRHCLNKYDDKLVVLYNPIDYNQFDKILNIAKKDFLYTGSLGHWNNIRLYLDFFLLIHEFFPSSVFKILTGTSRNKLQKDIDDPKYKVIKEKININYNVPINKLAHHYESCAYGLQFMDKKDNRVGVKFIEYIAAGIVPIVNENVQGAAYLSKKKDIGIVLHNKGFNTEEIVHKIKETKIIKKSSLNYINFKSLTDLNQITDKLIKIYLL